MVMALILSLSPLMVLHVSLDLRVNSFSLHHKSESISKFGIILFSPSMNKDVEFTCVIEYRSTQTLEECPALKVIIVNTCSHH